MLILSKQKSEKKEAVIGNSGARMPPPFLCHSEYYIYVDYYYDTVNLFGVV